MKMVGHFIRFRADKGGFYFIDALIELLEGDIFSHIENAAEIRQLLTGQGANA